MGAKKNMQKEIKITGVTAALLILNNIIVEEICN